MIPYFLLYIFILANVLLGYQTKKNVFAIICVVALALFAGFRYEVGVDYENYIALFYGVDGYVTKELGFIWIINILKGLGFNAQMLFLLTSALILCFFYKSVQIFSLNKWISLFIYLCVSTFFLSSFNGVRQYVAISVFLYSLKYIYSREFLKYSCLITLVAFFFHFTIVFMIPLYLFLNNRYSNISKILMGITSLISLKFLDVVIGFTPYAFYVTADRAMGNIHATIYIFLFVSLFVNWYWNKLPKTRLNLLFGNLNLLCLLSLIIVIGGGNNVLAHMFLRLNSYFLFAYIFIIPILLQSIRNVQMRILITYCIYISVSLLYAKTILFDGISYNLVPYEYNFNLLLNE